jgi:hypothetical protein
MLGEILMIACLSLIAALAWYPCGCDYDPPPCSICTADAATVTVQISGFTDDACPNCDSFDATYVFSRTGADACAWTKTVYHSGCTGSPFYFGTWVHMVLTAKVLSPGTSQGWELYIRTNTGTYVDPFSGPGLNFAYYRWNSGSTADFDCTATRTMTLYYYTPDPTPSENPCNIGGLTVTVNP